MILFIKKQRKPTISQIFRVHRMTLESSCKHKKNFPKDMPTAQRYLNMYEIAKISLINDPIVETKIVKRDESLWN